MKNLNCSNHSNNYQISDKDCCCESQDELDLMITHLKTEIFEKEQSAKDYCTLENKLKQLQNEIQCLSEQKLCLEKELNKSINSGDISIANAKKDNENLMNKLKEINTLNKKLYGDNNNLYQVLEGKACEAENLKKKIFCQGLNIEQLKKEKCVIENDIISLKHLNNKLMNDIQNLKNKISLVNKENNELDNALKTKNFKNCQIIDEIKIEQKIKNDLIC